MIKKTQSRPRRCTCGGDPQIDFDADGLGMGLFFVKCPKCRRYTDEYYKYVEAVKAWNKGETFMPPPGKKKTKLSSSQVYWHLLPDDPPKRSGYYWVTMPSDKKTNKTDIKYYDALKNGGIWTSTQAELGPAADVIAWADNPAPPSGLE